MGGKIGKITYDNNTKQLYNLMIRLYENKDDVVLFVSYGNRYMKITSTKNPEYEMKEIEIYENKERRILVDSLTLRRECFLQLLDCIEINILNGIDWAVKVNFFASGHSVKDVNKNQIKIFMKQYPLFISSRKSKTLPTGV